MFVTPAGFKPTTEGDLDGVLVVNQLERKQDGYTRRIGSILVRYLLYYYSYSIYII